MSTFNVLSNKDVHIFLADAGAASTAATLSNELLMITNFTQPKAKKEFADEQVFGNGGKPIPIPGNLSMESIELTFLRNATDAQGDSYPLLNDWAEDAMGDDSKWKYIFVAIPRISSNATVYEGYQYRVQPEGVPQLVDNTPGVGQKYSLSLKPDMNDSMPVYIQKTGTTSVTWQVKDSAFT